MKPIITAALVLGLTILSCKKETQTTTPSDTDTNSTVDSMNTNSSTMPSDTISTVLPPGGSGATDSMTTKKGDSSSVTTSK